MGRKALIYSLVAALVIVMAGPVSRTAQFRKLVLRLQGQSTVEERMEQYGTAARGRMAPFFDRAGEPYPPARVVLLALKDQRVLQVYATSPSGPMSFVRSYDIHAASGKPGPKLKEGDRQVPEGIYRIVFLNPNSLYHLSLRLDYPNRFDREMAAKDKRENLGGDIMIHGSNVSVGCIAVGDEASEDLFVLAADVGMDNIRVIVSPVDFRAGRKAHSSEGAPAWTHDLYRRLADAMRELASPEPS